MYQIKGNLIVFQPDTWTQSETLRMSEHIHLSVTRCKSKNCTIKWKVKQIEIQSYCKEKLYKAW